MSSESAAAAGHPSSTERAEAVVHVTPLGFPWRTPDPFLFCVHHDDAYPEGNEAQGPRASLRGRDIGQDFAGIDGWRMYHGDVVPGFPQHPHRGFETVTIVRRGYVDHSDSLGATARFGEGDVQWLTAGNGISHAEMFPLREREKENPLELFQIWLNLPAAKKRVPPYFSMLWGETIPRVVDVDEGGRESVIEVIAGALSKPNGPSASALPPPPDSWAASDRSEVAIWTVKMAPGAIWAPPRASRGVSRTIYVFRGQGIEIRSVSRRAIATHSAVDVRPEVPMTIENGPAETELLILQGRPIGEPVAQHGPFVMNSAAEIQEAFADYRRTRFGGWPWPDDAPVHPREETRFARHPDGRLERPAGSSEGEK